MTHMSVLYILYNIATYMYRTRQDDAVISFGIMYYIKCKLHAQLHIALMSLLLQRMVLYLLNNIHESFLYN